MLPRFRFTTDGLSLRCATLGMTIGLMMIVGGCQDGPLYAIKNVNPWFTMKQWAADEKMGITDHRRREELQQLAVSMPDLPTERQEFWSSHLQEIYDKDSSPEMRRLAIVAAGKSSVPGGLLLIEKSLQDESSKVRMEACRALGYRREPEAARLLATTLGSSQDRDVRHAAIAGLAKHPGAVSTEALKLALEDRNPATQTLVIASLKKTTGKNLGVNPEAWTAALDNDNTVRRE